MQNIREAASVVPIKNPSSLKMRFNCGEDDNGKLITKSRSYSHVKPTAKELDVFNVAKTLESLQQHLVIEIVKQDNTSLNV
ncbi:MAG: DUF1659 domain-containing protein [Romboutsia sp.]